MTDSYKVGYSVDALDDLELKESTSRKYEALNKENNDKLNSLSVLEAPTVPTLFPTTILIESTIVSLLMIITGIII